MMQATCRSLEVMKNLAGWVSLVLCVHVLKAGEMARWVTERTGRGRRRKGIQNAGVWLRQETHSVQRA